jgi:hypothetical protein
LTPTGDVNVGGVAFEGRLDVDAEAGRPGDLNMLLSRLIGDGSEPTDCRRSTGDDGMGGDADAKEESARRDDPAKATLDRKEEEEIRDSPT